MDALEVDKKQLKTEMPQSQAMRHFVCSPAAASRAVGSAIVKEHRLVITVQLTNTVATAKSIPKNLNVF